MFVWTKKKTIILGLKRIFSKLAFLAYFWCEYFAKCFAKDLFEHSWMSDIREDSLHSINNGNITQLFCMAMHLTVIQLWWFCIFIWEVLLFSSIIYLNFIEFLIEGISNSCYLNIMHTKNIVLPHKRTPDTIHAIFIRRHL